MNLLSIIHLKPPKKIRKPLIKNILLIIIIHLLKCEMVSMAIADITF